MALMSSRLAAAQSLVALIQGIQNPTTNEPLFQLTKLGNVFDPGNTTAWCEVIHTQGQGGPGASGGDQIGWTVKEQITYKVTSGIGPYEVDSTATEISMLTIQDTLLPALRRHFLLPTAGNPTQSVQSVYEIKVSTADQSLFAKFPNGHTYRLWNVFITVSQLYTIQEQIP